MKNMTLRILTLSFVPFIMVLGNSMLIPVFTDIKRELQVGQLQVNLLISYFSFPAALLIPLLGFISDRIGRKKVLIPSLVIYGIGGAICGFSSILLEEPYNYILLGRIVQGLGAAGTSPIAMALISDMFSSAERSKVLGTIEAANGIGKVLSPILGSIIALIAWYFVFFSYSILTIPIAVLIWFFIKDTESVEEHKNFKKYFLEIYHLLRSKGLSLIICFIIAFISLFILYGILANLSDIIGEVNKNHLLKKGFFIAIPLLTMSIVSYWFGNYLQNRKKLYKILTLISLTMIGMATSTILLFPTYIYQLMALEIIGIGVGGTLTVLNMFVTSCMPPGKRGVITAVYNSFRFLGISFGPIFFNDFHNNRLKVIILPIILILVAILFLQYVNSERMLEFFDRKKNL